MGVALSRQRAQLQRRDAREDLLLLLAKLVAEQLKLLEKRGISRSFVVQTWGLSMIKRDQRAIYITRKSGEISIKHCYSTNTKWD